MRKFYITYGTSDDQPFIGGWSTVYAESDGVARQKHVNRHGFTADGFGRFSHSYSEEEFRNSPMSVIGNHGYFEHEVIE